MNRGKLLFTLSAGICSALFFLSPTLISVAGIILVYFAPLPIAITGLTLGVSAASIAAAVSALSVGFVLISAGGLPGMFTVLLITIYLPVMLIIYLALRHNTDQSGVIAWYPINDILSRLTCTGLFLFLIVAFILLVTASGFRESIEAMLLSGIKVFSAKQANFEPVIANQLEAIVPIVAKTLPSTIINTWMIFLPVLNCVIAQKIALAQGRNIRPNPSYQNISVSVWLLPLGVVAAFLAALDGEIGFWGLNIFMIVSVPFFFIGLAVLHSISASWPGRPIILTSVYLFLVLLYWPAIIIVALGALEHWLRLRERMNTRSKNRGND